MFGKTKQISIQYATIHARPRACHWLSAVSAAGSAGAAWNVLAGKAAGCCFCCTGAGAGASKSSKPPPPDEERGAFVGAPNGSSSKLRDDIESVGGRLSCARVGGRSRGRTSVERMKREVKKLKANQSQGGRGRNGNLRVSICDRLPEFSTPWRGTLRGAVPAITTRCLDQAS